MSEPIKNTKELNPRIIDLTEVDLPYSIDIGRSKGTSKRPSNRSASPSNLLFNEKNVSRLHGCLTVSEYDGHRVVEYCDKSSQHGSVLNDRVLSPDESVALGPNGGFIGLVTAKEPNSAATFHCCRVVLKVVLEPNQIKVFKVQGTTGDELDYGEKRDFNDHSEQAEGFTEDEEDNDISQLVNLVEDEEVIKLEDEVAVNSTSDMVKSSNEEEGEVLNSDDNVDFDGIEISTIFGKSLDSLEGDVQQLPSFERMNSECSETVGYYSEDKVTESTAPRPFSEQYDSPTSTLVISPLVSLSSPSRERITRPREDDSYEVSPAHPSSPTTFIAAAAAATSSAAHDQPRAKRAKIDSGFEELKKGLFHGFIGALVGAVGTFGGLAYLGGQNTGANPV